MRVWYARCTCYRQTDYAAQVARLQDELRRIRTGEKSSKNAAATANALKDIRARMGDIRTQTIADSEAKMADESKRGDNSSDAATAAHQEQLVHKLRRRLAKELSLIHI